MYQLMVALGLKAMQETPLVSMPLGTQDLMFPHLRDVEMPILTS